MKKLLSIAMLAAACLTCQSIQAAVVTQWSFNDSPDDASSATGTLTPSTGSGNIGLFGNSTATFAGGTLTPSQSSDPSAGPNNSAWNISGFTSAAQFSDGIQGFVSTVGLQNVSVSWDQRTSNSSSKYVAFFYTIDGANWLQAAGSTFTAGQLSGTANPAADSVLGNLFVNGSGDRFHNNRIVDLSSIAGVNDNANFGFRIVSAFDPNTNQFTGTNATFATTGTWRFDMVTVSATAIPEPTSMALLGVAGLTGLVVRRCRTRKDDPTELTA